MATPTLPGYATACLQLIKPPASGRPLKVPLNFVDTVAWSLSKLVVLYSTTMRPFSGQIKSALRSYIAPTSSDNVVVPQSLKENSRNLLILLTYTAPKNGSSDEWVKAIRATILDCHTTADQVFRAVRESWESTTGYHIQPVNATGEPSGGGDSVDELPPWSGLQAGAERLTGLLEYLTAYFNNPTRAPVNVPLGELLDLTTRLTLVIPPSLGAEDSIETNPAIGRDEKAELWSALPDIHNAVLRLHCAIIRRLEANAIPLATDIIDQMVRVSTASKQLPSVRETAYILAKEILLLAGSTLPKLTVDILIPLIQSSCHDILTAAGHAQPAQSQSSVPVTASKQQKSSSPALTNADAFLPGQSSSSTPKTSTASPVSQAASALLPTFFTHLPQKHLPPDIRGLLDRTAILSHNQSAMLASCLHPYRDSRGRYYPSILPFLVRRFPRDESVEVLRSNLVKVGGSDASRGWDLSNGVTRDISYGREFAQEMISEEKVVVKEDETFAKEIEPVKSTAKPATSANAWGVEMELDVEHVNVAPIPETTNPFATVVGTTSQPSTLIQPACPSSPLKRKSDAEEFDEGSRPKRVDTGKAVSHPQMAVISSVPKTEEDKSDESSDSEGSVQIDMTLEDDEEDEEEEDE